MVFTRNVNVSIAAVAASCFSSDFNNEMTRGHSVVGALKLKVKVATTAKWYEAELATYRLHSNGAPQLIVSIHEALQTDYVAGAEGVGRTGENKGMEEFADYTTVDKVTEAIKGGKFNGVQLMTLLRQWLQHLQPQDRLLNDLNTEPMTVPEEAPSPIKTATMNVVYDIMNEVLTAQSLAFAHEPKKKAVLKGLANMLAINIFNSDLSDLKITDAEGKDGVQWFSEQATLTTDDLTGGPEDVTPEERTRLYSVMCDGYAKLKELKAKDPNFTGEDSILLAGTAIPAFVKASEMGMTKQLIAAVNSYVLEIQSDALAKLFLQEYPDWADSYERLLQKTRDEHKHRQSLQSSGRVIISNDVARSMCLTDKHWQKAYFMWFKSQPNVAAQIKSGIYKSIVVQSVLGMWRNIEEGEEVDEESFEVAYGRLLRGEHGLLEQFTKSEECKKVFSQLTMGSSASSSQGVASRPPPVMRRLSSAAAAGAAFSTTLSRASALLSPRSSSKAKGGRSAVPENIVRGDHALDPTLTAQLLKYGGQDLVIEIGSKLLTAHITKDQAEKQMRKAIELGKLGELDIARNIILMFLHENIIDTDAADIMFQQELEKLWALRISQAAEESAEALTLDLAHVDLSTGLPSSSGGTDLSSAITEKDHGAHALSAGGEAGLRAEKIQ
jgi:hypothetical protein